MTEAPVYKKKDFVSDQEVRWCPGCGDYAILSSVQMAMTKLGVKKEDIVCVSGIGCSSRFPYYMATYGLHTIHGRAPGFASGVKVHNPDLSVWLITGDGDGLSIGGNHLIHAIRRNMDINIMLFNNEIYGLTKGQYSPTSKPGIVTKSSPYGSLDRPFVPGLLAHGAGTTFYARTLDTDPKHMMETFKAAHEHKGASFIEIFQNCVIFNDKVHDAYTNRQTREDNAVFVKHGEKLIYGKEKNKGLIFKDFKFHPATIGEDGVTEDDIVTYDETNEALSYALTELKGPIALGILRREVGSPVYNEQFHKQIDAVKEKKGKGSMKDLLFSGDTWQVK